MNRGHQPLWRMGGHGPSWPPLHALPLQLELGVCTFPGAVHGRRLWQNLPTCAVGFPVQIARHAARKQRGQKKFERMAVKFDRTPIASMASALLFQLTQPQANQFIEQAQSGIIPVFPSQGCKMTTEARLKNWVFLTGFQDTRCHWPCLVGWWRSE